MRASCTLVPSPGGTYRARHSSDALGTVEVTAPSREQAVRKMRDELQYRLEMCPCSGASVGRVELQVSEQGGPASDRTRPGHE